jgi:hypothetical protein
LLPESGGSGIFPEVLGSGPEPGGSGFFSRRFRPLGTTSLLFDSFISYASHLHATPFFAPHDELNTLQLLHMLIMYVFAPKIGTRPIRLTPPVRPVSLNGLAGGASCSRSGNGHTGLTGGPDRWTPSPGRIEESLRISRCKRIPCGARPPHPINIKGHSRLR